jgi:hypothetical protein
VSWPLRRVGRPPVAARFRQSAEVARNLPAITYPVPRACRPRPVGAAVAADLAAVTAAAGAALVIGSLERPQGPETCRHCAGPKQREARANGPRAQRQPARRRAFGERNVPRLVARGSGLAPRKQSVSVRACCRLRGPEPAAQGSWEAAGGADAETQGVPVPLPMSWESDRGRAGPGGAGLANAARRPVLRALGRADRRVSQDRGPRS